MYDLKQGRKTQSLKYPVDNAVIFDNKINSMKDDEREFSWSVLFMVTCSSSFLFNGIIKIMDGSFSNLFLIVGLAAGLLALLNWGIITISRQASKKRRARRRRFAS